MRVNPFGALLADCGKCAAYGAAWGDACSECGLSKGYPIASARSAPPKPLPASLFVRPAAEVVPVGVAHPPPEIPAHPVEVTDAIVPRQPRQMHAAALRGPGWSLRLSHSRGSDLDPKTGEALGVVDAIMLRGESAGSRFAAVWIAGLLHVCGECVKPLRLTAAGIFRVHYVRRGDAEPCQGSGVRPGEPGEAEWRMEMAYWQSAGEQTASRPGFLQLKSLILEAR